MPSDEAFTGLCSQIMPLLCSSPVPQYNQICSSWNLSYTGYLPLLSTFSKGKKYALILLVTGIAFD